jgi:tetratricopeptide (TPR) repeat protein
VTRVRRRILLACAAAAIALAPAVGSSAESLERIFSAGNEAYFRGDFATAIEHYTRLAEAGVHDPDVYFNLATAHARRGELGRAVLYFERCLWLRAGDDGAGEGLAAARALLGKRRAEREGEATVQARPPLSQAIVSPISADALAFCVLVLDVLFFAGLFVLPRMRRDPLRLGLTIALPVTALALLAAGAGLAIKSGAFAEGDPAIVLRERAELREGPDPKAQVRAQAHEGEPAEVLKHERGFARVRLSQGARGWISTKDLATIRPD